MRTLWMVATAGLLWGVPSVARAQDSSGMEPARAERLRQLIEDRFTERLATELGLSDEQALKVRGVLATWAVKRRGMEREDRRLHQTLNQQMRPGVAANPDSVSRIVDAILSGRELYSRSFRDELKDLAPILSPVQRGQYLILRDRLLQRVQEVKAERQQGPAAGGPLKRRLRP